MSETFGITDEEFYPDLEYRSIKKTFNISESINSDVCSKCGGICCKTCGCHYSPDDFDEISFESLKKEIEKGYISIDYIGSDMICEPIGAFILRIRNKNAPVVETNFISNPCALLTQNGCKLDYENRPTGGKLMIPSKEFKSVDVLSCYSMYTIDDCCYEWRPHQRILRQLAEFFFNKDIPCSL